MTATEWYVIILKITLSNNNLFIGLFVPMNAKNLLKTVKEV